MPCFNVDWRALSPMNLAGCSTSRLRIVLRQATEQLACFDLGWRDLSPATSVVDSTSSERVVKRVAGATIGAWPSREVVSEQRHRLAESNIESRCRDCGSWRVRGGASSRGREFRGLDRCGWRESFSGSSAGCMAQSLERPWPRMGRLNRAGRIHSRQRAALLGVVRN
jgi:hypothetical protein